MYIEARDRAIQFRKELVELLKKYDAYIYLEEESLNRTGEVTVNVHINTVWDINNKCIMEGADVKLGSYIDGDL
jgi:hypothetical protein